MTLIHAKPRFGYDDATDMVYDYLVQRDLALTDRHEAPDGVWDLNEVKRLILLDQPVETARVGNAPKPKAAPPAPFKPKAQGGLTPAPSSGPAAADQGGLSADELKALGLTPLQQAALGLTRSQIDVTGIPRSTIDGWGITAARADALKLNEAQRDALMSA